MTKVVAQLTYHQPLYKRPGLFLTIRIAARRKQRLTFHNRSRDTVGVEQLCACHAKMADDQSQHVTQIPQAVSIAASVDPSTPTELRQQAVEYLQKVKELSEQTWKVSYSVGS
jgi:hypothetical protein